MYSLLNFPAIYFSLIFLNQLIFYVFTKRFSKLSQKMEISMTPGHKWEIQSLYRTLKTDLSYDQKSPIPQGRAKIYGQFFMQHCVNKFLLLHYQNYSVSFSSMYRNTYYLLLLVRRKLPLTHQFSPEIHGTGTERRAQVRPQVQYLNYRSLEAVDRTSGQPNVKMSLLRSLSLTHYNAP